jgi:hypothetical protein
MASGDSQTTRYLPAKSIRLAWPIPPASALQAPLGLSEGLFCLGKRCSCGGEGGLGLDQLPLSPAIARLALLELGRRFSNPLPRRRLSALFRAHHVSASRLRKLSHAARCTAIHGSRSHADPTAEVTECARPAG